MAKYKYTDEYDDYEPPENSRFDNPGRKEKLEREHREAEREAYEEERRTEREAYESRRRAERETYGNERAQERTGRRYREEERETYENERPYTSRPDGRRSAYSDARDKRINRKRAAQRAKEEERFRREEEHYRREEERRNRRSYTEEDLGYGRGRRDNSERGYEGGRYNEGQYEDSYNVRDDAGDSYRGESYNNRNDKDGRYNDSGYGDERYRDERYDDGRYSNGNYGERRYGEGYGAEGYDGYDEPRRKKKKKRKHPVLKFILILILILIIITVGLAFRYYSLSNYVEDGSTSADTTEGLPANRGVYNLLLVGVDRRDTSWYGNSDSMILVSISSRHHSIYMISFMRDLGVDIPGVGTAKLNAACANGGLPLLVQTIEENFKVNIDNYAAVDFASMIQIVDFAGGVELTVSADEAQVANGYISDMANTLGGDASQHYFPSEGGTVNADGYQAVAYSRIRYVGNSDYQRTARQRSVLSGLLSKIRRMNPVELNSFITNVMPLVTHNIDSGTMASLLPRLAVAAAYPVRQDRVPYDGYYTIDGEMLMPDLTVTNERLHDTIYGSGKVYLDSSSGTS